MKTSHVIAIGIVIALVLWISSGYVINGSSAKPATQAQLCLLYTSDAADDSSVV